MHRFSISLILLSALTFNTQASSILAQESSTGADGLFNLLSDSSLFASPGNIYNFTDFTIAAGATLYIAGSGPVYIYSQQNITIKGSIIASTLDLHLTASQINLGINSSITIENGSIMLAQDTLLNTSSGAVLTNGNNLDTSFTTGIIDLSISTGTNSSSIDISAGVITVTSVPLPAALWLMITGLLSFGLMRRRDH